MEAKHSHLTKMQELEVSPLCPWVKKMMIDDFKKMSIGGKVTSQPYQPVDKLRKRRLRPEFRKSDQLDKKVMSSPYKSPPDLVVKHVLVLAALQHILRKLDLHLLSSSSLFDLLLHKVVVPSKVSRHINNDCVDLYFKIT